MSLPKKVTELLMLPIYEKLYAEVWSRIMDSWDPNIGPDPGEPKDVPSEGADRVEPKGPGGAAIMLDDAGDVEEPSPRETPLD